MPHKLNILFIDDDYNITNGIKRSLFPYRKQWDLFFTLSGLEAIKVIDHNDIDIVFCDIMMPVIDGTQVLEYIFLNKPNIVRFVLSGHSNLDFVLKSTKYAHQFLTKPSAPDLIVSKIQAVLEARKYLTSNSEKETAHIFKDSPVSSYIYKEIKMLLEEEDVNSVKIANVLRKDPALTGKILQIANSGFFALSREITEIQEAVNYIGINLIHQIVLFYGTFNNSETNETVKHKIEIIAQKSLQVAYKMQYLVVVFKLKSLHGDDAFTCGLLHLLGQIVAIVNNKESPEIQHENVAAYLISIWGLPKVISDSIAFQNNPMHPDNSQKLLSSLLYLVHKLTYLSFDKIEHFGSILEGENKTEIAQIIKEKFDIEISNLHDELDLSALLKEF